MKCALFTIFSVFSCFGSFAQNNSLKDFVIFKLPANANRLTTQQLSVQKVGRKYIQQSNYILKPVGEFYSIDATLLHVNSFKVERSNNFLEKTKQAFDHLAAGSSSNYRSEILQLNNLKVLLIFEEMKDESYFVFYGLNDKNTKAFNGRFVIDPMDKDSRSKAEATLKSFLSSVEFVK